MDVEEMLKLLLAKMTAWGETLDANMESMQERMDANQAELKSAIPYLECKEPASVEMKPEVQYL
jgi:hypothetical protein